MERPESMNCFILWPHGAHQCSPAALPHLATGTWTLQDVFALMKERLKWEPDPEMQLHVFAAEDVQQGSDDTTNTRQQQFEAVCKNADVFLAVDMKGQQKQFLETVKEFQWPAFLILDSASVRHLTASASHACDTLCYTPCVERLNVGIYEFQGQCVLLGLL